MIKRNVDKEQWIERYLKVWCILPLIVSISYLYIYDFKPWDSFLILTYYQIMLYYILVCFIGIVGAISCLMVFTRKTSETKIFSVPLWRQKWKEEPWIVLMAFLLGWSLISALTSSTVVVAFIGTAIKRDGYLAYVMYASVMALSYWLKDEKKKKSVLISYLSVANVMGLVQKGFETGQETLFKMSHDSSCSVFMNPNHYGYYICMALMCALGLFYSELYGAGNAEKGKRRISLSMWYYIISFAWQMYSLNINDTMGAWLAVVVAMVIMALLWSVKSGRIKLGMFIPAIITAFITWLSYIGVIVNSFGETIGSSVGQMWRDLFKVAVKSEGYEQAGTNRIFLWKTALEFIPKRPILGYGPEGFTTDYKAITGLDRPHNEYIQWAAFCGIPALVAYICSLIMLCVNRVKNLKKLSAVTLIAGGIVIGYLISAFFGFTLFYTTPYFYMCLGFVAGSVKEKDER